MLGWVHDFVNMSDAHDDYAHYDAARLKEVIRLKNEQIQRAKNIARVRSAHSTPPRSALYLGARGTQVTVISHSSRRIVAWLLYFLMVMGAPPEGRSGARCYNPRCCFLQVLTTEAARNPDLGKLLSQIKYVVPYCVFTILLHT